MHGFMQGHPEWDGLVQAITINQDGSQATIEKCGEAGAVLPIGQDGVGGIVWNTLKVNYNSFAIVDSDGKLVHKISPANLPEGAGQLAELVQPLL